MSILSEQKKKVIKYFDLLVKQFIKEKELYQQIKVSFEKQEIEGHSWYDAGFYYSCFWDKNFASEEFLCEVAAHEFTHIYFLIKEGLHEDDDRFFSYAENFEDWLRKNKDKY